MVASGDRPSPIEAAAETAPFEKTSFPPPPRVQQKFNSPKISLLPNESLPTPAPPFPQKIPPHAPPRAKHWPTRAFSGHTRANLGQNRAISGRFWVDFWLFRVKIALIWAPFPPPGEPLLPGRRAKTSPPSPRTQTHHRHSAFPKSHKIVLYYHK